MNSISGWLMQDKVERRQLKVASRFMLPVEMLLGFLTIICGLVGAFGHGTLHNQLSSRGESVGWLLTFGVVGLLQVGIAVYEWSRLRGAPDEKLLDVARVRSAAQFATFMAWAASAIWILIEGMARTSMMLMMVTPVICAFAAWAFVENQKVRYALDPDHATTTLRFTR